MEEKHKGGAEERGPCVRMGKNDPAPCGQTGTQTLTCKLKCQSGFFCNPTQKKAATMAVAEAAPAIKNLGLVNYTSRGPYGQASQRDRWTEYHNKKPSVASQLPDGLRTGGCRLTKSVSPDSALNN